MKIKIINYLDPTLIPPTRKHYNDAGADVFSPISVELASGSTAIIPLGFGVEIPDGYFGLIYVRSSMAAKGLTVELPPIDSGYRGQIHAIIRNHGPNPYKIEVGDRIGQLVIQPVVIADFVEELAEERGTGAFGSTGR